MFQGFKVGVVVPAFNEELLIKDAILDVPEYVDKIIVVDDCSTDNMVEIVKNILKKDDRVILEIHEKNKGVGSALTTGYLKSIEENCDLIAVMAGDNQMEGKYLTRLLKPLVEDRADYTKGNRLIGRKTRESMPKFRLFGNSLLSFLTKVCSGYWDVVDPQNGYTAVKREVIESINLEDLYPRYGYPNDLLIKLNVLGYRILDVHIPAKYGLEKSKIKYGTYIPKVSKILVKGFFWRLKEKYILQSFHPLIFFFIMGFCLIPLGIISSAYMVYLRFMVAGNITASSVIVPLFLFTVGLQSLFFAMLFDMEAAKK